MTITEKILARASVKSEVSPNDVVEADIDVAMVHDITGLPTFEVFEKEFGNNAKIWDKNRIVVIEDHSVPCKDIPSAENVRKIKNMVKKYGINHYYPFGIGEYGICHVILPYGGFIRPGEVVVGADSHTVTGGALGAFATGIGHTEMANVLFTGRLWFKIPDTILFKIEGDLQKFVSGKDIILEIIKDIGVEGANYKSMEFTGSTIRNLEIDERLTICNMAVEAGAKNGIIEPDGKTVDFISRWIENPKIVYSDLDAQYEDVITYQVRDLEPLVAKPYLPSNVVTARELEGTEIDKAYIGSCTGGKYSDLREAATIMKNKKVSIRTEVVPATQSIYKMALRDGLIDIFIDSGAVVGPPTCGACLGMHMGVLGKGEKCISSTNRNFKGRMGHMDSEVYLASSATVAASAVKGSICDPRSIDIHE